MKQKKVKEKKREKKTFQFDRQTRFRGTRVRGRKCGARQKEFVVRRERKWETFSFRVSQIHEKGKEVWVGRTTNGEGRGKYEFLIKR